MPETHILVDRAARKTGAAVVDILLVRGCRVRALVPAADRRSAMLDHLGAQVLVTDLCDADQVEQAMVGIDHACYCQPIHPNLLQSAIVFAAAANRYRLKTIVSLGHMLASPRHPSLHTRQHWYASQLFSSLPATAHSAVRPAFTADQYLRAIDIALRFGVLPTATGSSVNAPPCKEDIGGAFTAILMNPQAHARKIYRPTGLQMHAGSDMAALIGAVRGKCVRSLALPVWAYLRLPGVGGGDKFAWRSLRHDLQDLRDGGFSSIGTTGDIAALTGSPAERFAETVSHYLDRPVWDGHIDATAPWAAANGNCQ